MSVLSLPNFRAGPHRLQEPLRWTPYGETNVCSIVTKRKEEIMRIFLNIIAFLLILVGAGWFLQGINVLPGSFMTGQIEWAVYGGIAIVVGIGLLVFVNRRKDSSPKK